MTSDLQITVAQLRATTGRCAYHSADLGLVEYADEGLEDLSQAWYCPAYQLDPEVIAWWKKSHGPPQPEGSPAEIARRKRIEEWSEAGKPLRRRCEESWWFSIPLRRLPGTGISDE